MSGFNLRTYLLHGTQSDISAQVFHQMFVFQLGFPDVTSCTYIIKNWVNALNKTFTQIPQTHMVSTLSLWLRKCIQICSLFSSLSRLTFVCYLSFCVFNSSVLFCFVLLDLFCTYIDPTQPVGMGIVYISTFKTPSFPESTHEMSGWMYFLPIPTWVYHHC